MTLPEIRELVKNALQKMGRKDAQPVAERLLLRDRHYVGRRFEFVGVSAVWLAEAEEIKFYGASGEFLRAIQLSGERETLRRAA